MNEQNNESQPTTTNTTTNTSQTTPALAGLLSDGWSVMRTDVLPGLGGKGEYKVEPNICYEPPFPPTIVYILEKEAE